MNLSARALEGRRLLPQCVAADGYDEGRERPAAETHFLRSPYTLFALPSRYARALDELRRGSTIQRMSKLLAVSIVAAAILAGCGNGAKDAGPVPTGQATQPQSETDGSSTATETTGTSSLESSGPPLCKDSAVAIKVDSQEGAAGTIGTVWRVTNTSSASCRSFGYPGMDFHAASGWLDVQVQRGGLDLIDQPPASVTLAPGQSMYFMSFWGDVDTNAGPCTQFDRVKVTLPDNFTSARIASEGCVDPGLVRVGPVSSSRPS